MPDSRTEQKEGKKGIKTHVQKKCQRSRIQRKRFGGQGLKCQRNQHGVGEKGGDKIIMLEASVLEPSF